MALDLAEVERIARLAHLALATDDLIRYRDQLSAVLEYAQRLQELDTDAIPPTATILPTHTVMRPDCPRPSSDREESLSNAPDTAEGMYRVPTILEVF